MDAAAECDPTFVEGGTVSYTPRWPASQRSSGVMMPGQ